MDLSVESDKWVTSSQIECEWNKNINIWLNLGDGLKTEIFWMIVRVEDNRIKIKFKWFENLY